MRHASAPNLVVAFVSKETTIVLARQHTVWYNVVVGSKKLNKQRMKTKNNEQSRLKSKVRSISHLSSCDHYTRLFILESVVESIRHYREFVLALCEHQLMIERDGVERHFQLFQLPCENRKNDIRTNGTR